MFIGQNYDSLANRVDVDCTLRKASISEVLGTYHGQKSITFEAMGLEDSPAYVPVEGRRGDS